MLILHYFLDVKNDQVYRLLQLNPFPAEVIMTSLCCTVPHMKKKKGLVKIRQQKENQNKSGPQNTKHSFPPQLSLAVAMFI